MVEIGRNLNTKGLQETDTKETTSRNTTDKIQNWLGQITSFKMLCDLSSLKTADVELWTLKTHNLGSDLSYFQEF